MRVVYAYRHGILGGVCTQLINRLAYLRERRDFEATVVFGRDAGVGASIEDLAEVLYDVEPQGLQRIIADRRPDVVVVIDTPEFMEVLPARRPYALVAEVHTSIPKNLAYLRGRAWKADAFVVPSRHMGDSLIQEHDVDRSSLYVVPNCLDTELFRRRSVSASSRPILGWVGKIDDHKKWRDFIAVSAMLRDRGYDFEMWLAGGETCPSSRALTVFDEVAEAGLDDRFRWLDRLEIDAMPAFYSAIAASGGCKLVTSQNESFGMSVLEALMCECPVVSPRIGALLELLDGQPHALLYDSGDVPAAAGVVADLLDDGSDIRAALRSDQPRLRARYSPEAAATKYYDLFAGLTSTARERTG